MNNIKIDWEKFFDLKIFITFDNHYEYELFKEKLSSEFTTSKKCVNNYTTIASPDFVYGNTRGSEYCFDLSYNLFGDNKRELIKREREGYNIHQMTEFMLPEEIEKINKKVGEREMELRDKQAGGWGSGRTDVEIDHMDDHFEKHRKEIEEYNMTRDSYEWRYGKGTWGDSEQNKRFMGWDKDDSYF